MLEPRIIQKIRNILNNIAYLFGRLVSEKLDGFIKGLIESFIEGWGEPIKQVGELNE
jgi:hypothetical protein